MKFTTESLYEDVLMRGNTYFITQKLLKILAYIIVPIFLTISEFIVISSGNISILGLFTINSTDMYIGWSQFTARTAFFLLMFILYLKPLMKILPNIGLIRKLMLFRRQLGIATFYFAVFHMINALFYYLNIHNYNMIDTFIWFKYGTISIFVLFLMYLTSNNYSVRLLKRNWKKLQNLIHFSVAVLFIHMFLVYSVSFKTQGYWIGFWDAFSFTFYIFLYYVLKAFEHFKVSFDFPPKLEIKKEN